MVIHSGRSLLLPFAIAVIGCSRPADLRDVPGTFVMNRGRAADTLTLQSEGRYRRAYVAPGQEAVIDTGTWSVDTVGRDVYLTFDAFTPRWRAETSPPAVRSVASAMGYWPARPERTWAGDIQLVVDDDLGWAYVKRGPD
jgi:hypothetical protein